MSSMIGCAKCPRCLLALHTAKRYNCSHDQNSGITRTPSGPRHTHLYVCGFDLSRTFDALVTIVVPNPKPRANRPGWLFCLSSATQETRMG
jgi:hypothetical protein